MSPTTRDDQSPPQVTALVLVAMASLTLGFLNITVELFPDGGLRASYNMLAVITLGPSAVILYYFMKVIGRPIHPGLFASSPALAAAGAVLVILGISIPRAIHNGPSIVGLLITGTLATMAGVAAYKGLKNYYRRSTPRGLDDDANPV